MEAVLVDIVSRVVTPRATRAGAALGSIQNENLNISVGWYGGREGCLSPGHDDQHAGGHVDGQHVVGELPPQSQFHQKATVFTCFIDSNIISNFVN